MNYTKKELLLFLGILVTCIIVTQIPWDIMDRSTTRILAALIICPVLAGAGISILSKHKKIKDLQNRCLVKVSALCVGTSERNALGGRSNIVSKAFYEYEYMGRTYRGCNGLEAHVSGFQPSVKYGDRTEIYINPDCLPDDIYDPNAEYVKNHCLNLGTLLLAMCAVGIVLALLSGIMTSLFHLG